MDKHYHRIGNHLITRPLLVVAVSLSLGIVCARFATIPFYLVLICACLSLTISIIWFKKRRVYTAGVLTATFFLGCLLYTNSTTLPANHIKYLTPYKSRIVTIEGVVTSFPITRRTRYGKEKIEFIMRAERLTDKDKRKTEPSSFLHTEYLVDKDEKKMSLTSFEKKIEPSPFVRGKVKVIIWGRPTRTPGYGDRIKITGKLYRPPGKKALGFDYRGYLALHRIYSLLSAKPPGVEITGENTATFLARGIFGLKERWQEAITNMASREGGREEAALLRAVLLGDRHLIPKDVKEAFVDTGTVHTLPAQCIRKSHLYS